MSVWVMVSTEPTTMVRIATAHSTGCQSQRLPATPT